MLGQLAPADRVRGLLALATLENPDETVAECLRIAEERSKLLPDPQIFLAILDAVLVRADAEGSVSPAAEKVVTASAAYVSHHVERGDAHFLSICNAFSQRHGLAIRAH